jgi:hypothetical protein
LYYKRKSHNELESKLSFSEAKRVLGGKEEVTQAYMGSTLRSLREATFAKRMDREAPRRGRPEGLVSDVTV